MEAMCAFLRWLLVVSGCVVVVADPTCTNGDDLAVWQNSGMVNFDTEMNTCSRNCWAMEGCVTNCFKDAEHYSPACAECFGSLSWCTIQNCWLACMGGEAEKCNQCSSEHCLPGFLDCSGLKMEDVHGGIPAPASAVAPAPAPTLTAVPQAVAPAPAPMPTSVPQAVAPAPTPTPTAVPQAAAPDPGFSPNAATISISAQDDVSNSEQLRRRLAIGGALAEILAKSPVTLLV